MHKRVVINRNLFSGHSDGRIIFKLCRRLVFLFGYSKLSNSIDWNSILKHFTCFNKWLMQKLGKVSTEKPKRSK